MAEEVAILQVLHTVVGVVGVIGNGLVCLVIGRVRSLHTLTNAFIVNQAVADLLGSLFLLLYSNMESPEHLPAGVSGVLLCRLWASRFFQWACFITSTFNLVGLTFERYVAIVYPLRHHGVYTKRNAGLMLALAWVIGTLFATYSIAIHETTEDRHCVGKQLPTVFVVGFLITVVQYTVPTFSMLFAYAHIMVVLHRGARRVCPAGQPARRGSPAQASTVADGRDTSLLRARRNTFRTLLVVFLAYFCCWTPNLTVFAMFNLGFPLDFSGTVYVVSVALAGSNSCVNPVIYAIKYRQFQEGCRKLFCPRLAREASGQLDSISVVVQRSASRGVPSGSSHQCIRG